jgi:hypothetical protein
MPEEFQTIAELAERFRKWLRNRPREPAERMAMALAAVDALEACKRGVSATTLRPLVIAASSPHKLVFETGCNLLVWLAARHTAAQDCFRNMARDKKATARFHAVAFLDEEHFSEPLRREIVQLALDDRSPSVRLKGIERAEQFRFTDFLPRLEEMQRTETNKGVRQTLAMHLPILRDGFFLRPAGDGNYLLIVRRRGGELGGPFISKKHYSEEFVRQQVARLRAEASE